MKFILAVSVWLICSALGINQWLKTRKRSSLLENTALVIDCFRNEMQYSALPLDELIKKYSGDGFLKTDFLNLCNEKLNNGYDFPYAWKSSVENAAQLLDEQEKNRLMMLGDVLGTSDSKSQCEFLKMQQEYFGERAGQAKAKTEKYAGSFLCTGVFVGFAFFIFIV